MIARRENVYEFQEGAALCGNEPPAITMLGNNSDKLDVTLRTVVALFPEGEPVRGNTKTHDQIPSEESSVEDSARAMKASRRRRNAKRAERRARAAQRAYYQIITAQYQGNQDGHIISTPTNNPMISHRPYVKRFKITQPSAAADGDLRYRLANIDARRIISERCHQREDDERKRREEYDRQWGPHSGCSISNQPPQASRKRSQIHLPYLDDLNNCHQSCKRKPEDAIASIENYKLSKNFKNKLDKKCLFHPNGNHPAWKCYGLQKVFNKGTSLP